MTNKDNNYMGYSLFNDVEDAEVRNRNRGMVMLNMYEDHCRAGILDAAGLTVILGYFKDIPAGDRADALGIFQALCQQRGYASGTPTTH